MESLNQWFLDPIKHHYFDFAGRVTRQQYWMFVLWSFIVSVALSIVSAMVGMDSLSYLFALAVTIPSIALATRRLHDIGKSGWWQLLYFVPIIGVIVVIVWLASQGDVGVNAYGQDPKGGVGAPQPMSNNPTAAPVIPTQMQNPNAEATDNGTGERREM